MDLKSKILISSLAVFTFLSVASTFYKTIILQDFEMEGAYVEFSSENSSKVWYVYDHTVYELELETTDLQQILAEISFQQNTDLADLPTGLVEYVTTSHSEAVLPESEAQNTSEGPLELTTEQPSEEE
jgi:hypothetical protein